MVDHLRGGQLAELPEGLADPVEDDHRLIHRIAQHGQHSSQHRQRELPLKEREEADDDDHVVEVGDDAGDRKLPLEPDGEINHDAGDRRGQRQGTVARQFGADRRPDKFAALQSNALGADLTAHWRGGLDALVGLHRLGGNDTALSLAQRSEHLLDNLGLFDVTAHGQANEDIARGAELLHLDLAEVQCLDRRSNPVDIGGLGVGHFDHRPACELDRQMKPPRDDEKDCGDEGDGGDHVQHQGVAHERDIATDPEELHGGSLSDVQGFTAIRQPVASRRPA